MFPFGVLKSLFLKVMQIAQDQTKLILSGQASNEGPTTDLWVASREGGKCMLLFTVTTALAQPVELQRVAVEFRNPVQLRDPGNNGFFRVEQTINNRFPFQAVWNGSEEIRSTVHYLFGLEVEFGDERTVSDVRVSIQARRLYNRIGGFRAQAPTQVVRFERKLKLADAPLLGLRVPPQHNLAIKQPYLAQSSWHSPKPIKSATVHEVLDDGTTKTTNISS